MFVIQYGNSGPMVLVLHGGPAAVGDAAPVAKGISGYFRAVESWQRGGGAEPLTVARHIDDLHELAADLGGNSPVAILGHSWGAMLALCDAAAHPGNAGPIVLVGCGTFDLKAHDETWSDMRRLQDDGTYPGAFSAIESPVLMVHGEYDPHPGKMIRDSLLPFLPQLEYHELECCGHSPWIEKSARDLFFSGVREWLERHTIQAHQSAGS